MHASLVVLFGIFALSAGASLGQGGQIVIQASQKTIQITDQDGQQVVIGLNQQGGLKEVNGPQTIVIQIGGPGRIPKTVEIPDLQVTADGLTQSDILQSIFQQASGAQTPATYQAIMEAVATKVAKAKVNPAILAALETVSPKNEQDDTAMNQVFRQIELKLLEKEALTDALRENQMGSAAEPLVVEAGIDQFLVANAEGQQVNIAINQQSHLGAPKVIQIQVIGPKLTPRSIRILDQQAAAGMSQGEILLQIAKQSSGVLSAQSYQMLLSEIAQKVATGQVSPAVLAALKAVAPQNQHNPAVVNQLLDEAQQVAQTQGIGHSGLGLGGLGFGGLAEQQKIQLQQQIRPQQYGGQRAYLPTTWQGRFGSQRGYGNWGWASSRIGRQGGLQSGLNWNRSNLYAQVGNQHPYAALY